MDQQIQSSVKGQIAKVMDVMRDDLATIRTGRANPGVVEHVLISAYGGSAKLRVMELATVSVSDAQTIVITPFDASIIGEIQKGIQDANTGLTPMVDGHLLRITIPPLSQERREELIKMMKHKLENGRIMVRQVRQKAMDDIKKNDMPEDDEKRLEKEVQKIIDDTMASIDTMGKQKETELVQI